MRILRVKNLHLLFILTFFPILTSCVQAPPAPQKNECIILLHGMGRTSYSMKTLEKYLSARGYQVINQGYPSTSEPIKDIAENYVAGAVEQCLEKQPEKIHFVTHSLGGILVRQYLQNHSIPEGSRVVMLSPPNKGSELADYLRDFWLYKWRNGPAGQELGTGPRSVPNNLEPVNAEIGVLTGNMSFNPMFSQLIPGEDDGKVSVERAKLAEMNDFIVIPATHTFIMKNKTALEQVLFFIENGKFKH